MDLALQTAPLAIHKTNPVRESKLDPFR